MIDTKVVKDEVPEDWKCWTCFADCRPNGDCPNPLCEEKIKK